MPDDGPSLSLHDVRPEHVTTHRLLERVLAELAEIRADVRALATSSNGGTKSSPYAGSDIVPLIALSVGSRAFSAAELCDHCRLATAATLRTALAAAVGADQRPLDPRRVGKLLQRLQSVVIDGYVIRRVGADRDGAVWACESAGVTPVDPHHGDRYRRRT